MPIDRKKDELADALRALSEGAAPSESLTDEEHVEKLLGEIEHATPTVEHPRAASADAGTVSDEVPPSDAPSKRPLRPPVPGARPIAVTAPLAPKPNVAAEPVPQPTKPEPPARPAPPRRADVPTISPRPEPRPLSEAASDLDHVHEDDLMGVPAPSTDMLASSAARRSVPGRTQPRSLFVQRTIIPILLTISLLLPALTVWLARMPEESQLYAIGQRTRLYLYGAAAIFLALAIVNMLQVRSRLKQIASAASAMR